MFKKGLLFIVLFFLGLALFLFPSWAQREIQGRLQMFFKNSAVLIGALGLESSPPGVSVSEIAVHGSSGLIEIKKASFYLSGDILLDAPRLSFKNFPAEWMPKDVSSQKVSPALTFFKTLTIKNFYLEANFPDFKAGLEGSAVLDLKRGGIRSADFRADSFERQALKLSGIKAVLAEGSQGSLQIKKISYGKLKSENASGKLFLKDPKLSIQDFSAPILGGSVFLSASFLLERPYDYEVAADFQKVDLESVTKDFEFEKKISADGKLIGKIILSGDFSGVKNIQGSFTVTEGGGNLVIQDKELLNRVAQNVRQPVEIVELGFKEYHFDIGKASVGMNGQNLHVAVALDGEKGKRNFEINLHDLFT